MVINVSNVSKNVSVFLDPAGLICSEGTLWRAHRRWALSTMKTLGMRGAGRRRMAARVGEAAKILAEVRGAGRRGLAGRVGEEAKILAEVCTRWQIVN